MSGPDAPPPGRGSSWGRDAKRIATAVAGGLLVAIGVLLLVLPGPGVVVIAAGLAVLAREFTWARRPLDYAQKQAEAGLQQVARS